MRPVRTAGIALASLVLATGCARGGEELGDAERAAISAEVEAVIRDAYDLSKPGVLDRMLALYPRSGRVVSAVGGGVLTSRDSIESGIRYFWNNVGINMREPRWEWNRFYVDVLSPTSAAVTATYRIPHLNPRNEPHVLGGAMTVVLSKRDGRWLIIQEHLSDLPQGQDSSAHD
jgi:uncharacterized protein (TIGR02246 family)